MGKLIVDTTKLMIDISKLNHDFLAYETNPKLIEDFSHNDLINDWHIERIRRLNAIDRYLIASLERLQIFGTEMMNLDDALSSQDETMANIYISHRISCRDVCINLDIYTESVKSFCRYYFFMDRKSTDSTIDWCKALRNYSNISGWNYIETFISTCKKMFDNRDAKFLTIVRNEEVHNMSPLDLINYKFHENNIIPIPLDHVITNQEIHNKIVSVTKLLTDVVSALQNILNNISPIDIYKYLSPQDGCLSKLICMEDRYKKEREYVKQFQ